MKSRLILALLSLSFSLPCRALRMHAAALAMRDEGQFGGIRACRGAILARREYHRGSLTRLALIGFAAAAALLTTSVSSSDAQFFSRRFCTQGARGEPDCSYNTLEQCIAATQGLGRYCTENPFWKPEGSRDQKPLARTKPQRSN
jgi:Protein of unknown function (DUF3551)